MEMKDVAAHEAGHAVILLIWGYPFQAVSIEKTNEYLGVILPDPTGATTFRQTTHPFWSLFMDLCMFAAGEVAVSIQNGDKRGFFPGILAINPADPVLESRTDDAAMLVGTANAFQLPVKDCVERGLAVAHALLSIPSVWGAVERIRDMTLVRRVLPYVEAKTAFDEVVTRFEGGEAISIRNRAYKKLQQDIEGV